jgi:hypothetical protein
MTSGGEFGSGMKDKLWALVLEVANAVRKLLIFVVEMVYYYFWSWKAGIRDFAKLASLSVLSISSGSLAVEIYAERVGAKRLSELLTTAVAYTKIAILPYLVVVGAVYLFWHHFREARKPAYESRFVERLCQHLQKPGSIKQSLELFHSVFVNAGVTHASIYTPDAHGGLEILKAHVYPDEPNPDFYITLGPNEGVAGLVYDDKNYEIRSQIVLSLQKEAVSASIGFLSTRDRIHLQRIWEGKFPCQKDAYFQAAAGI